MLKNRGFAVVDSNWIETRADASHDIGKPRFPMRARNLALKFLATDATGSVVETSSGGASVTTINLSSWPFAWAYNLPIAQYPPTSLFLLTNEQTMSEAMPLSSDRRGTEGDL